MTTFEALNDAYGDAIITLSSANAYSYGRIQSPLGEYLRNLGTLSFHDHGADEIFYFFGEHGPELQPLLKEYPLPRYTKRPEVPWACERAPALSFGAAANGRPPPALPLQLHCHSEL